MNQKLKRASSRLLANRLLRYAGGVGALVTALGATYELVDVVSATPPPALEVQEAQRYIDRYVDEIDDSLLKVAFVVRQVYKRSIAAGAPGDCSRDPAEWSEACKLAREQWQQDLIKTMEKEAAHDALRVTQFFYQTERCVETDLCDETTIRGYFDAEICRFWQQTSPFIKYEADLNTADAQWLESYCDGDKCSQAAA